MNLGDKFMTFEGKLKDLRIAKGLTQQELAENLSLARVTYAQYELGKREPSIETLRKLATYFNVTTDFLLDMPQSNKPVNVEELVKTHRVTYRRKRLSDNEKALLLRVMQALFTTSNVDER